ncbi:hypothetical protein [Clostridium sp. UBA7503]|uniref:hypothetical protein n=1 Tax=Clostridium sp. UBA7503 TaxID=1946377 RepID=UPI0032180048
MKKRILTLLLVTTMAITMVGCGSKTSGDGATAEKKTESNDGEMSSQKNLFDVEVTLPAAFFDGSDKTTIETEAKAKGVHEVKVNEDGSVTYIMDKKTHKELLASMKQAVDESIKETLADKENYPSFAEIKYNDDLTQFDIMVDKATYGGLQPFVAVGFYMSGNMYQAMNGKSFDTAKTIVNFKDKDTGEVIESGDSSALGKGGE